MATKGWGGGGGNAGNYYPTLVLNSSGVYAGSTTVYRANHVF